MARAIWTRHDQLRPGQRAGEGVHAPSATTTSTSTSSTRRSGARDPLREGVRQDAARRSTPTTSSWATRSAKGRYVTFDTDELDELKPASTRTIDVTDFVDLADIDPIYYERTYWLAPDGDAGAHGPTGCCWRRWRSGQRVGIGTVVMRNKQYLAAIRPLDGALAMSTMRFADEVVPARDDRRPARRARPKPDAKELKLATQIIDALAATGTRSATTTPTPRSCGRASRPSDKGEDIVEEAPAAPRRGKVVDLMAALEASVAKANARRPPHDTDTCQEVGLRSKRSGWDPCQTAVLGGLRDNCRHGARPDREGSAGARHLAPVSRAWQRPCPARSRRRRRRPRSPTPCRRRTRTRSSPSSAQRRRR